MNTKIFNNIKVLKGNHSSCQRKETCGKPNIYQNITTKFKNKSQTLASICGLHGLVTILKRFSIFVCLLNLRKTSSKGVSTEHVLILPFGR